MGLDYVWLLGLGGLWAGVFVLAWYAACGLTAYDEQRGLYDDNGYGPELYCDPASPACPCDDCQGEIMDYPPVVPGWDYRPGDHK